MLPLPKGRKYATALGFCAGAPVANVTIGGASPPHRWLENKAQPLAFQDIKKITGSAAAAHQVVGSWISPKGDDRAVLWSASPDGVVGVELHPAKWDKSYTSATDGQQQVGYGYEKFAKQPTRGLLWEGGRDSLVVLTGPDAEHDTYVRAVWNGAQGGNAGGGAGRQHACVWRGSAASFEDLHPGGARGSEIWAMAEGQQAGITWGDDLAMHAAAWAGSAASHVELHPEGFHHSRATACAHGFQAGSVAPQELGMLVRAALWHGGPQFLDLHALLPDPWTASWAVALDVDGDRLRILGTAQQAVKQGGYEVNAGTAPVVWEFTLKTPGPAARRELPAVVAAASDPDGDEHDVEHAAATFAKAVIGGDWKAAHALLAPWLAKALTAKKLQADLDANRIADVPRADYDITGNDISLRQLKEFSPGIPPEVTDGNFRQWVSIEFLPEDPDAAGVDFMQKVWVVVVETPRGTRIGYLEHAE